MSQTRHLRHALGFTAGLFAVLGSLSATLGWGARHARMGDAGKISQVMLHRLDTDLAVFGASNAETGISPAVLERETGQRAYNLALDGTGIEQFGALVRELSGYAKPGTSVILAVSAFALMNHDAPTAPSRYWPHVRNPRIYASMAAFDPALAWRIRYVPFYDFVAYDHGYYKSAVEGLTGSIRGLGLPDDKGFTPKDLKWVEPSPTGPVKAFDCTVDARIVAMYRSLIDELDAAGRRVVIVFPPIQSEAPKGLRGLDEVEQAFAQLAGAHAYLDYRQHEMGREKRYFYNYTHLNAEGAEVFSTILGRDLRTILGSPQK